MTLICVLQPSFIPWLGYFDQIFQSDVFVFLDDVQYTKQDWRNRNRIKLLSGNISYLTVPVRCDHHDILINEVEINYLRNWRSKHLKTLQYNYGKAPFFKRMYTFFEEALDLRFELLSDLNIYLIKSYAQEMNFPLPRFVRSSDLSLEFSNPTERLLALCEHFESNEYLSGVAAKAYLEERHFQEKGIKLRYQDFQHPRYRQFGDDFVSHLSILDSMSYVEKSLFSAEYKMLAKA